MTGRATIRAAAGMTAVWLVVSAAVFSAWLPAPAVADPAQFDAPTGGPRYPVDVAATPEKMFGLYCLDSGGWVLVSYVPGSGWQPFATFPQEGVDCGPKAHMEVSQGLGGFPQQQVFISINEHVYRVDPAGPGGQPASLFARIPIEPTPNGAGTDVRSLMFSAIAFDDVGGFGFDLLAASNRGRTWRIDSLGVVTPWAEIPDFATCIPGMLGGDCGYGPSSPIMQPYLDGIDVAPASVRHFPGQLFVPGMTSGKIYAVSGQSVVSTVADINPAGDIDFAPEQSCSFAGGSYFAGEFDGESVTLTKFPPSDVQGLFGSALIHTHHGRIARLDLSGEAPAVTTFWGESDYQSEGAATFVQCPRFGEMKISDAVALEGTGGSAAAVFAVELASPVPQLTRVGYSTSNGSATAGKDFVHTSGELIFSPGETAPNSQLKVPIIGDGLPEPNENFFVDLSNPQNAVIKGTGRGVGTIVDDDVVAAVIPILPSLQLPSLDLSTPAADAAPRPPDPVTSGGPGVKASSAAAGSAANSPPQPPSSPPGPGSSAGSGPAPFLVQAAAPGASGSKAPGSVLVSSAAPLAMPVAAAGQKDSAAAAPGHVTAYNMTGRQSPDPAARWLLALGMGILSYCGFRGRRMTAWALAGSEKCSSGSPCPQSAY